MLPANNYLANNKRSGTITGHYLAPKTINEATTLNFQDLEGASKMRSVIFKSQQYCRADLKDFEFDVHFSVVSANVYFSGTNFKGVEKGAITSNKLKPLEALMTRCAPGSIVVFDDVKVMGPDNLVRTIPGETLILY